MRALPGHTESSQPATPAERIVSDARQHPAVIAGSAKTLGYLFARLAGSRDAHKATARTLARLQANLGINGAVAVT
jgi:hypothetical protein